MNKLRLILGLLACVAAGALITPWRTAWGESTPSLQDRKPSPAAAPSATAPQEPSPPGGKVFAGPVEAQVTRIVDGDTIEVVARTWIEENRRMLVRLSGVNAPELHARCAEERTAAESSRQALSGYLGGVGAGVVLRDIQHDKYGGRVRARVATARGRDVAEAMMKGGYAAAYSGGRRPSYCAR